MDDVTEGDGEQPVNVIDTRQDAEQASARERVRAYLRGAGVSDAALLDSLSRQIVDDAASADGSPTGTLSDEAIGRAIWTLDQWLDYQFGGSSVPVDAVLRGSLIWELRAKQKADDRGFVLQDEPMEILRAGVRASAVPVVPPRLPRQMSQQPLGELPTMLQRSFWGMTWYRLEVYFRRVLRTLWGQ